MAGFGDNCDFVAVNLLGGEQRPITSSEPATNFEMGGLKSSQRLGLVMGDIYTRNSAGEDMAAVRNIAQRFELFDRQLHFNHAIGNAEDRRYSNAFRRGLPWASRPLLVS